MRVMIFGTLTAVFLTLMVYLGFRGPATEYEPPAQVEEDGPHPAEATVRNMVRYGEEGDLENYLDSFVGRLRTDLENEVTEKGREAFADELIKAASVRKGHVVHAAEPENRNSMRVGVESTYADRNERRTYRVMLSGETWKISGVSDPKDGDPASKPTPVDPEVRTPDGPETPKSDTPAETGEAPRSP